MTSTATEIYRNLSDISKATGSDFLELSSAFPVLINELNTTGSNSQSVTNRMKTFSAIQNNLSELVAKQNRLLKTNMRFLSEIREKNTSLFNHFSEKIHLLEAINNIILGIKDGSEEMEVISLNAMVVSIQSGKEGQAFSYITSNLKQMSLRLISQSDQLIKSGERVQNSLKQLDTEIQKENDLDNADFMHTENYEEMLAMTGKINSGLKRISELSKMVRNPITKAMEGIQIQDIIRQSLDDILIALGKMKEPDLAASPESQLQQYSANTKLSELCARCLEKVKEKLDKSIELFSQNREDANSYLNEIDQIKSSFNGERIGSGSVLKQLSAAINTAISDFNSFADMFISYQNVQNGVLDAVRDIQNDVIQMSGCFSGFLPIINNLQYVAIAQRIEVARNEAIRSIKDTVEHMSKLIQNTNESVETAQKKLADFTDSSNKQIQYFLDTTIHDKNTFNQVIAKKKTFSEELTGVYSQLENAISDFSVYTPEFYECYEKISDTINRLKKLSERLAAEKEMIERYYEENVEKRDCLIKEFNIEDTSAIDSTMQEFLEHFTITEDRLEVGSISGLNTGDNVESGEITFF